MGKVSVTELASRISKRYGLNKKEATNFVTTMFDVIQEALETDKVVKIKGLGTFKIIDVDDRESVNVNTGERVLIEGHNKITFTPEAVMKELVNKPFSQFETVVLNEGVDFDNAASNEQHVPEAEPESQEESLIEAVEPEESEPEAAETAAMPLVDFVDDEDIPEWVIEPIQPSPAKEEPVVERPAEEAPAKEEPLVETPVAEEAHTAEEPIEESPAEEAHTAEEPVKEEPVEEKPSAEDASEEALSESEDALSEEEESEDYDDVEYAESSSKKWWLALLACLIGLVGGYFLGNYFPISSFQTSALQEEVQPVVEEPQEVEQPLVVAPADSAIVDSVAQEVTDNAAAEKAEAEKLAAEKAAAEKLEAEKLAAKKAAAEKAEADRIAAEKKAAEAKAAAEKAAAKAKAAAEKAKPQLDEYQKKDVRVRTGAWRIAGTAQVVKVKEGETLAKISRRYLGPDMDCYVEVYNGLTASSPLKAGQSIKIPKLIHKKAVAK